MLSYLLSMGSIVGAVAILVSLKEQHSEDMWIGAVRAIERSGIRGQETRACMGIVARVGWGGEWGNVEE